MERENKVEYDVRLSTMIPEASESEIANGKVFIFNGKNLRQAPSRKMKGEKGDKVTLNDFTPGEIKTLQQPATDAAAEVRKEMVQISKDASQAIKAATDAAGNAQDAADNVKDGKTPVLESVNAQSGDTPSGSFSGNGVDESGNPKYVLNLTLPAGKDGQPAIFEQGTTTTLEPTEEARVEVVENGETAEGNPKYILNFFIPRGQIGKPGTGSGNVSVDGTGLVTGKKYLFVPNSDGSTAGTFVEYEAPEIPEQVQSDWGQEDNTKPDFVKNKPTIPKEQVNSDWNATEGKAKILNKPTIPEVPEWALQPDAPDSFPEAPADGKTYGRKDKAWAEVTGGGGSDFVDIPYEITLLTNESDHDQIVDAVGGEEGFAKIVEGARNAKQFRFTVSDTPGAYIAVTMAGFSEDSGSGIFVMFIFNDMEFETAQPYTKMIALNLTPAGFKCDFAAWVPGYKEATPDQVGLMSSADKTKMDRLRSYTTASTVASLNVIYEVISVTLNANASLSVSGTGTTYNGRTITAFVYTAAARTITIPTSGNYVSMCGSSYTTKAGKWVEFNLTCVDGKWHIAKLEQE